MILGNGLEEIEEYAFYDCTSLVSIKIPPAIRVIHKMAFNECSNLTTVRFCNEIKEFVTGELMLNWGIHWVHEKCLITYCFFVRCNIPEHLGQMQSTTLQTNIHGMLSGIPSISPKGMIFLFNQFQAFGIETTNIVGACYLESKNCGAN